MTELVPSTGHSIAALLRLGCTVEISSVDDDEVGPMLIIHTKDKASGCGRETEALMPDDPAGVPQLIRRHLARKVHVMRQDIQDRLDLREQLHDPKAQARARESIAALDRLIDGEE